MYVVDHKSSLNSRLIARMICNDCEELEKRILELENALKLSQNRTCNALRQASKMKLEIEAKEAELTSIKETIKNVESQENLTEKKQIKYEKQIQELTFRNARLVEELGASNEKMHTLKLKSKARLLHISQTLENVETASNRKTENIKNTVNNIQSNILDLQRNLGNAGYHHIQTPAIRNLFARLWDSCASLCDISGVDIPKKPSAVQKRNKTKTRQTKVEPPQPSLMVALKSGEMKIVGQEEADQLFHDLSTLCSELEKENIMLSNELENQNAQIKASRIHETRHATLIPKYRMAVLQARARVDASNERISTLETEIVKLQEIKKTLMKRVEKLTQHNLSTKQQIDRLSLDNKFLQTRVRDLKKSEDNYESFLGTWHRERESTLTSVQEPPETENNNDRNLQDYFRYQGSDSETSSDSIDPSETPKSPNPIPSSEKNNTNDDDDTQVNDLATGLQSLTAEIQSLQESLALAERMF